MRLKANLTRCKILEFHRIERESHRSAGSSDLSRETFLAWEIGSEWHPAGAGEVVLGRHRAVGHGEEGRPAEPHVGVRGPRAA